jgi:hypothetical protein
MLHCICNRIALMAGVLQGLTQREICIGLSDVGAHHDRNTYGAHGPNPGRWRLDLAGLGLLHTHL